MTTHGTGSRKARLAVLAATLVTAGALPAVASAQSGSWNRVTGAALPAGGFGAFWDTATNWTGSTVANGQDNTATFATPGLTQNYTVALNGFGPGDVNGGRTIGNLVFDNPTNNFGWTIDQNTALYVLTLQTTGAALPNVAVNNANITAVLNIPIYGTQGFTKSGPGNLSLTQASQFSGSGSAGGGSVVINGGTLTTDYAPNFVALGGQPILPTVTDVVMAGGTFTTNAGSNQQVNASINSLSINPGTSVVAGTVPTNRGAAAISTGATITLGLGGIFRATGGVVQFSAPQLTTTTLQASTNPGSNSAVSILGGWATYFLQPIATYTASAAVPPVIANVETGSSMFWATANASTGLITPLNTGATLVNDAWAAANNTSVTVAVGTVNTIAAGSTTNSLRFANSATAGYNVSLAGGTNTITSGGIMIAPTVGGYGATAISSAGGSLTSGSGELIVNNYNPVTNFTISAPIVGATGLTAAGNGNTIVSGVNTYSGTTNVSTVGSAYLLAQTPGSLPGFNAAGMVVVNTGTLAVGTTDATSPWTAANIDTLRANATFASGTALAIDVGATPFTYNSIVSGVEGLAKNNTGVLTLGGASTFTGPIFVNGGTLTVATVAASGTASPIGAGSSIVLKTGGTLQYTGATTSINRNVTLGFNGGAFNLTNGLTLTGNVTGAGGLTLVGGNLTLSGANTYAGPTLVSGGSLTYSAASAVSAGSDLTVAPAATVTYGSGVSPSMASLSGSGTVTIGTATTVTVGADQASGVYSGVLTNGTGGATTLVKTGGGTQVVSGANNYTGSTTINGGTLQVSPMVVGVNPLNTSTINLAGAGGANQATLAFRPVTPLAASGFNQDLVWDAREGNPAIGQQVTSPGSFDGNWSLFSTNVTGIGPQVPGGVPSTRTISQFAPGINPGTALNAAPTAGTLLTGGNTYILQPYNGNNALTLRAQASGTLAILTPGSFQTVNVLEAAGNGATGFTATLNFSSGAPTVVTGATANDWFDNNPFVIGGLDRYNISSNVFDARAATVSTPPVPVPPGSGTVDPRLYQFTIALSAADQLRTLTSITFQNTVASGAAVSNTLNIMALNGVAVGVPTTIAPGNNVALSGDSAMEVSGYTSVAMGTLTVATAHVLSVVGTPGSTLSFTGTTLTGVPTFNVSPNLFLTLGTVTDNNAGVGLKTSGGGTVVIAGGSNYSANGTVAVNGGTLLVNVPAGIPQDTIAGHVTVASGATLGVSLGAPPLWQASDIATLLANSTFAAGSFLGLDVASGSNVTFAPQITAPVGIVKSDTGNLTFSAGNNTYTGGTVITGGALSVNTLAAGGSPSGIGQSSNVAGNLVFSNGAILQYTGGTVSTDRSFTLATGVTAGGGFSVLPVGTALTVSGAGTGTGPLLVNAPVNGVNGLGTLILTGANTYTGGTIISSGTLQIGAGGATGSLAAGNIADGGTLAFNLSGVTTFAGIISGTGGVAELGTGGATTLTGANTYTGPTTVTAGTLAAGNVSAFGVSSPATVNGGTLSLNGFNITLGSLASTTTTGTVNDGAAANVTLTVGNGSFTTYNGTIADGGTGKLSLVLVGGGTLTLTGTNTYSGGTNVSNGTLFLASDAASGTGPVTVSALGTLGYSANTSTSKSFNLGGGTLAVNAGATLTVNGGSVVTGYLGGSGTFATDPTNGARFANVTSQPQVTIASNSPADKYLNFTNGGAMTIPEGLGTPGVSGSTPAGVTFSGLVNQGSGSITLNTPVTPAPAYTGAFLNVSNFQSYGTLTVDPAVVGSNQFALITNTGTAPLGFNGGSRTFLGTPATATNPATGNPSFVAGIDIHGQNLVIAGGLFVNNGFVTDLSTGPHGTIVVDYGGLYKGAGFTGVNIVTQNGGKVQAGNSPGALSAGALTIGPGGTGSFQWQINDGGPSSSFPSAPGKGGPSPDTNNQVSGWSQLQAVIVTDPFGNTSTGNLTWTAGPSAGNQFSFALETLLGPQTTVGTSPDGMMADFNPNISYSWPFITYKGAFSGPTGTPAQIDAQLTADTLLDTSLFANALAPGATFTLHLDTANKQLDLLYTASAVPEPGTLVLTGLGGLAMGWAARRRKAKAAAQVTAV